jgi:hypothetical protein
MVTKITGALLLESGFFRDELSNEGMHVPDRVTRSFGTCRPTYRVVRVLSLELIRNEGAGVLSSLGFNNLFLNQPLPYRALYLTFRILLATRKCSFSLKICWAFKSAAQLIFSIENLKLKKKKKKKSPPALEGPLRSSCQEGTTFYLLLTVEVLCARTGTH